MQGWSEGQRELFPDVMFADLFPSVRGPAERAGRTWSPPCCTAGHCTTCLSDREAAEAVTFDLRWKAAVGLPVTAGQFHPTTLTYWRRRLAASERPNRIFDAVKPWSRRPACCAASPAAPGTPPRLHAHGRRRAPAPQLRLPLSGDAREAGSGGAAHLGRTSAKYQPASAADAHLVCRSCGRREDLDAALLRDPADGWGRSAASMSTSVTSPCSARAGACPSSTAESE